MIFLAAAPSMPAQETAPTPHTIEDALHQMSDLAAVIFLGQVIAVRHLSAAQGASGLVEIDFHINQAIRGCSPASTYTLREWAGLWESDDQRYQPGQNLLMMLHAPNAAGISSPVGGMNGAMPVRAGGSSSLVSATASPVPLIVDLRWVGTRLLRTIPQASSPSLATGQTLSSPTPDASSPTPDASISDTSVASQQASVSTVIGMLSSWQQAAQ
jgi:hypothetical protein